MNSAHQLLLEWFSFNGQFVLPGFRPSSTLKLETGASFAAYSTKPRILTHVEVHPEISSVTDSEKLFSPVFLPSRAAYQKILGLQIRTVEKIVVLGCGGLYNRYVWRDRDDVSVVPIPFVMQHIGRSLKKRTASRHNVSDTFPLLRTMTLTLKYGKGVYPRGTDYDEFLPTILP